MLPAFSASPRCSRQSRRDAPVRPGPSVRDKRGALKCAPLGVYRLTASASAAEARLLHGVARNVAGGRNALHTQLEVVGIGCVFQSSFVIDQTRLEQIP